MVFQTLLDAPLTRLHQRAQPSLIGSALHRDPLLRDPGEGRLLLHLLLARQRQLVFPLLITTFQPSPTWLHIGTEPLEFHFATDRESPVLMGLFW